MTQSKLKIICTIPLWLRLYIKALRLFADTFGMKVDVEKVAFLLKKHIKTEISK